MTSERAIPRMSAMFALIWGVWVLNPWGDVFSRTPSLYVPMLSLVPYEAFWGVLISVFAIAAEWFTFKGAIGIACLIIAIPFFAFATLYLMSDPGSPAFALWGWLGAYNIAIFWERRGEWSRYRKA
jgi:hypothetical protein